MNTGEGKGGGRIRTKHINYVGVYSLAVADGEIIIVMSTRLINVPSVSPPPILLETGTFIFDVSCSFPQFLVFKEKMQNQDIGYREIYPGGMEEREEDFC